MAENSKGFEIAINNTKHILRTRAWGSWDEELAKRYGSALREKSEEIQASGKEWYALVDLTRFYPCSEEVWRIMGEQIVTASKWGMKKVAYLGDKEHTPAQIKQGSNEDNGQESSFFGSHDEALQWLMSE